MSTTATTTIIKARTSPQPRRCQCRGSLLIIDALHQTKLTASGDSVELRVKLTDNRTLTRDEQDSFDSILHDAATPDTFYATAPNLIIARAIKCVSIGTILDRILGILADAMDAHEVTR